MNNKDYDDFDISEILEPLHHCLRELLAREEAKLYYNVEYTDRDIVAVTLLYTHILGNRMAHRLARHNADELLTQSLAEISREQIILITKMMSGLNIDFYYQNRGDDKPKESPS